MEKISQEKAVELVKIPCLSIKASGDQNCNSWGNTNSLALEDSPV